MDIDAFILIGGRSSRFGTDKAFVELDGETLATRAAKTIETALSPKRVTFVAASDDQFKGKMPVALHSPIITDLKPGFGAWSGLHAALAYAQNEWTFILACDMPFVSAELVKLLAANVDDSYEGIIPRQPDGRLQPLCALYRVKNVLPMIEEELDAGRSLPPLTDIFDELKTRIVTPDEYAALDNAGELFRNINTPADLIA